MKKGARSYRYIPGGDGFPAVRIRRANIPESDITVVNGLRVTTIQRTLVDLAGEVSPAEAARLIRQAVASNRVSRDELINVAIERTDIDSIEQFRTALAIYLSSGHAGR